MEKTGRLVDKQLVKSHLGTHLSNFVFDYFVQELFGWAFPDHFETHVEVEDEVTVFLLFVFVKLFLENCLVFRL